MPSNGDQKSGFGTSELVHVRETAVTAAAKQAEAAVNARYIMALQRPRNEDMARQKILHACKRPSFAAVAQYEVKRGRKKGPQGWEDNWIIGPSIRFIEEALKAWGNVLAETSTIYDDEDKMISRTTVTDLEANVTYTRDFALTKTREKKKLFARDDGTQEEAIGTRITSDNKVVYIVRATEADMLQKEASQGSKYIRTLGQRLLPGDLVDEAMRLVNDVLIAGEKAEDPDKARKAIADSFAELGVTPLNLGEFLGHGLDLITVEERVRLRKIFLQIKEGERTWAEVIAEARESREEEKEQDAKEKPLSEAEVQERATVVRALALAKLETPEAYAFALGTISLAPDVVVDKLSLGQLRQVAAALRSKLTEPAKASEPKSKGKGGAS